jgi:hypothetical protein
MRQIRSSYSAQPAFPRLVGLALALALLAGCTATGSSRPASTAPPSSANSECTGIWEGYCRALAEAKYPHQSRVSPNLVPIVEATRGLSWQNGDVLMVNWSKSAYFNEGMVGKPYTTSFGPMWLTASPFLQHFCQGLHLSGDELTLRLAQRLGLPPNSQNDVFVGVWVKPASFFRPCADPEITDGECEVNLTMGSPSVDGTCPWASSFAGQTSKQFVAVAESHLSWMCSNWTSTYTNDPAKSYPWTALGYTYDWGTLGKSHGYVGESEFVLPKNGTVTIAFVTPNNTYCRPAP